MADVVRFSVFEVDLLSGELRKRGVRVPLQHQPFRILVRLVERPGEMVSREALRQELWPADTFVDFEQGLNAAVKRLREALGDSAETPRFVETLPRRGYRFIAPVEHVGAPVGAELAKPSRGRGGSRYVWLIAAAIIALAGVAGVFMKMRHAPALTERDTILVADFANRTGDAVFDGALRQELTLQLEQSPFLSVVSRERVRLALRQMTRSADDRVVDAVAREVCQRVGAKVSVNGSIAPLGSHYAVGLEAVNCESGETAAGAQVEAPDREHVLNALDGAASALRQRLGESRVTLERFITPRRQATSASLDAIDVFTLAEETRERQGEGRAEPFYRRAIELDPDFAMAYARLSAVMANTGRGDEMRRMTEQAVARRDRVTEHERMYIDLRGCALRADSQQCWENVAELWRRTYPRDWEPYQALCWAYTTTAASFQRALPNCAEAVKLNPYHWLTIGNLAGTYEALNRFDDAKRVTDEALARGIDTSSIRRIRYELAFIAGDRGAMAAERGAIASDPEEPQFVVLESNAAAFLGRFREARTARDRADVLAAGRFDELREVIRFMGGIWEAAAGLPVAVEPPETGPRSASGVALLLALLRGDRRRAERLLPTVPTLALPARLTVPARTLLAIEAGDASAIDRLPPPDDAHELAGSAAYRPVYVRGLAYLRAGKGQQAAAEFQWILDHRGIAPTSPLYALAYVHQARGYALAGDYTNARRQYERFLALWKDADPNVPILQEAKAEYARLPAVAR